MWILPQISRERLFSPENSLISNVHFRLLRHLGRLDKPWADNDESNKYLPRRTSVPVILSGFGRLRRPQLSRSRFYKRLLKEAQVALQSALPFLTKSRVSSKVFVFRVFSLNLYRVFLGFALFVYINTLGQGRTGHQASTRRIICSYPVFFSYCTRWYLP